MTTMKPNRIVELASIIQEHTLRVDIALTEQNHPTPSFDVDQPPALPKSIMQSQDAILAATDELNNLMMGTVASLIRLTGYWFNPQVSLGFIQRFEIARSFGPKETTSFEAIQSKCCPNFPLSDVRRLLRHAMTYNLFREPSKGVVAHTSMSLALANIPMADSLVGMVCEEMMPAAAHCIDAMVKWPGSAESSQTGFAYAMGEERNVFDTIKLDERRAKQFADCMTFSHSKPELSLDHLLTGFEWKTLAPNSLIVDVGGSHGSVASAIARLNPTVQCVVQDRPEIVTAGRLDADVADRVQQMPHDFFAEQPVKGADIYLFRRVMFNWSDHYAAVMLRALVPAMKKGARVVINDACLPQPGVLSAYAERPIRGMDLAMTYMANGLQRDADDWGRLFATVDSRWRIARINFGVQSDLAVVTAVWEGEDQYVKKETVKAEVGVKVAELQSNGVTA